MKSAPKKLSLKLIAVLSLIGLLSFYLWNVGVAKVCTSPAYWNTIADKTQDRCTYSPLSAIFRLKDTTAYDVVAIGDQVFLEKVSDEISANRQILAIDTCEQDLRDVVAVMNWHAKNIIASDVPIIVQGGPQVWTNPGFYGGRLDTQPWIKSQTGGFPNKELFESCFDGLEMAFEDHKKQARSHERQKIDDLNFKPNVGYLKNAKKALASKSKQILWIDDRENTGDNPEFLKKYEAWVQTFPAELGSYAMGFDALDKFKEN